MSLNSRAVADSYLSGKAFFAEWLMGFQADFFEPEARVLGAMYADAWDRMPPEMKETMRSVNPEGVAAFERLAAEIRSRRVEA